MPFEEIKKIWMNGQFVDFADAKVHVLTHAIHYGSGLFEGIRCYVTKNQGPAIFRLNEHIRRLYDSCRIYRMDVPFTQDEFKAACVEIVAANEFEDCYLRPLVYRGFHSLGVYPGSCPVDVTIAAWQWGKYLGVEAIEHGVDVRVSSWNRMAPNTFPALAKATANYMNSILIRMEAAADGYAEGIALDVNGYVSEGSGENIFLVRDGKIYTPPLGASVLAGITRDSIIRIARDLGYEVIETLIPREMLYIVDEVFFTGTAAEVTPVRTIDRVTVGNGRRGPITEHIQREYFAYIGGEVPDRYGWLTPVYPERAAAARKLAAVAAG
ncbi:MAG: branched-chain amino acid aminotransferase [Acidobacteriota bacterium]|jgi:branched-chain amino acid aminotransferase|nr:branched-chain amino acid aminotransferase [Acidobacteriota bacterium]